MANNNVGNPTRILFCVTVMHQHAIDEVKRLTCLIRSAKQIVEPVG
jgi:hypothetical protein